MIKIKICGFTDPRDVKIACDLGVDMVGAILVPKSPRCLTFERAKQVLAAASDNVARVAVVKTEELSDLQKFVDKLRPDYLQIHLALPLGEVKKARKKLDVGFIVVAPVPHKVENRQSVLDNALQVAEVADIVLVDTQGPTGGGTGLTHDWSISREIRGKIHKPVFLAGGLNPSNVMNAIRMVKPDGVDVTSGVESSPGRKDKKLMHDFIKAAKSS